MKIVKSTINSLIWVPCTPLSQFVTTNAVNDAFFFPRPLILPSQTLSGWCLEEPRQHQNWMESSWNPRDLSQGRSGSTWRWVGRARNGGEGKTKAKTKQKKKMERLCSRIKFCLLCFFPQGIQILCPKEHTTFPDQLPEIVSERLRKQGFYLFLWKPQLDTRCLMLQ